MINRKFSRVVLTSILAVLLSYSVVYACSPVEPTIFVKCSNLEVSIVANRTPAEGDTYESVQERWVNDTIKNLHAIVPECAEDLTPVLDTFEQEIVKWLDYKNKRGAFLDGNLILEPYSANKDFELQKDKNSLLSCGYAEYKHIGNWLVTFETNRSYCHTFWFAAGMCPSIIFSLGHFLFYLVTNLSLTTLPYLVAFLIVCASIIYSWWRFLKNRSNLKRSGMVSLSFAVFVAELFLLIMPFWLWGQIIGWISFIGVLVLWYKYLKNGEYISNQKAG